MKQDLLLFVDNIFRFTQAGSEVSALLGRIPSAVGYQPTLSTEMGGLQERITSTKDGSITSVQAIYVPADDLTDPAPATAFAHLDATTVLNRAITEKGIYPAVDPLDSTSTILTPAVVGERHYKVAREVQRILQRYKDLQDIIAILGMDELSRRRQAHRVARPQDREVHGPAVPRRRDVHRHEGHLRVDGRHRAQLRGVLAGKCDDLPEQAFEMTGTIDDVRAKAAELAKRALMADGAAAASILAVNLVTPQGRRRAHRRGQRAGARRARRVRAAAGTRAAAHRAQAGRADDRHEAARALRGVVGLPARRSERRGRDPRRAGGAGEATSTPRPRRTSSKTAEAELAKWGDKAARRRLPEPACARRLGAGSHRRGVSFFYTRRRVALVSTEPRR